MVTVVVFAMVVVVADVVISARGCSYMSRAQVSSWFLLFVKVIIL